MDSASVGRGESRSPESLRRWLAMLGFAADRSWWLAAVTGLALSAAVALWLPGVLSGSRLHGREVWLSCVLWQPLLEEVFFRGILQGELLNRPWARWRWQGVSVANLLCSLAFSAVHFLHHPPLWAASVFLPSLLFGWMRERHHGIGASLALHSLFNLEFFLAAALVPL